MRPAQWPPRSGDLLRTSSELYIVFDRMLPYPVLTNKPIIAADRLLIVPVGTLFIYLAERPNTDDRHMVYAMTSRIEPKDSFVSMGWHMIYNYLEILERLDGDPEESNAQETEAADAVL